MPLSGGVARVDITPVAGLPMAGFPHLNRQLPSAPKDTAGYFGRQGYAEGVHDPLYARVLVLENGQQKVVLISLDLIVVTQAMTDAIRAAIHEAIGVAPQSILIGATHTHAGPDLFGWDSPIDPSVLTEMNKQIVFAACQADANRRPVRVGWGDGQLDAITINRRDPENGPIDPSVGVMLVASDDDEEEVLAVVVNFGVHPVMLSAINLLYSGDLPGYAMTAVERIYPNAVSLFMNGAAGNINPIAYPWEGEPKQNVIPVFREAWHKGLPHPRTFRNTARLGHILASVVVRTIEQIGKMESTLSLGGASERTALPLREASELAQCLAFMAMGEEFGQDQIIDGNFMTEVQAIAIGDRLYVGLPGEPFVELGFEVQRRLAPMHAYIIGCANDDPRYILPAEAYLDNRYETWGSILASGSGEMLVEAAVRVAQAAQENQTQVNHA
jgi:neutral ceramidase